MLERKCLGLKYREVIFSELGEKCFLELKVIFGFARASDLLPSRKNEYLTMLLLSYL